MNPIVRNLRTSVRFPHSRALPAFSIAAIEIGMDLHRRSRTGDPYLVVIVVPSRRFFSLFVALGSAGIAIREPAETVVNHEPGTPVLAVWAGGSTQLARFLGTELQSNSGVLLISLQLNKHKRIKVPSSSIRLIKLEEEQSGSRLSGFEQKPLPSTFTTALRVFEEADPLQLFSTRSAIPRIIGTKTVLEQELLNSHFTTEGAAEPLTFADLLLTRSQLGIRPAGLLEVMSSRSETTSDAQSSVIIYDGAHAVLQQGLDVGSGASIVVVLEANIAPSLLGLVDGALQAETLFANPVTDWAPAQQKILNAAELGIYQLGTGSG